MEKFENKVESFVNNMSTKDAYVLEFFHQKNCMHKFLQFLSLRILCAKICEKFTEVPLDKTKLCEFFQIFPTD